MISDDRASEPWLALAAQGYRSTVFSQAVRALCKAGSVVVLARLVSPAEHGLFAMAVSLIFILTIFRDFGFGIVAIQAPELSAGQEAALFQFNAVLGVVLAGLTLALTPVAVLFYHEPRLRPLLAVMGGSFVLIGAGAWPRVLLARQLRYREINRFETLGAVAGTAAMIVTGACGGGAYSFAAFLMVSEAVMTAEAWRVSAWRPRAPARWSSLRAMSRPGGNIVGYNLFSYFLSQIDTLLMGKWFGAAPLGFYNRASQLLTVPALHLATPFAQVLLVTLSRLGPASPSYARHARDTANVIAHCTLPVATVCLLLPDEVVHLALGAAWPDAAPLLRWLALSAVATYLTSVVYALCVAPGNSGRLTFIAAISLPVITLGVWLGGNYGPTGLAAGLAVANLSLLLPRLWLATRGTTVRLRDLLAGFIGPVGVAAALGAGLLAGRTFGRDLTWLPRLTLAGLGGVAGVALCVLAWPRAHRELQQVWTHLPFRRTTVGEDTA